VRQFDAEEGSALSTHRMFPADASSTAQTLRCPASMLCEPGSASGSRSRLPASTRPVVRTLPSSYTPGSVAGFTDMPLTTGVPARREWLGRNGHRIGLVGPAARPFINCPL